uniref:Type II secretory protein n=1 Tax=Ignisphaera aggregans TaxID=334771 RepID=A0A7C4FHL3_9CREN
MLDSEFIEVVDRYRVGFRELVEVVIASGFDGKLRYFVKEPHLDSFLFSLRSSVYQSIFSDVGVLKGLSSFFTFDEGYDYVKSLVVEVCRRVFGRRCSRVSQEGFDAVSYYVLRDFVGYGEVDPFVRDPEIEDITCDGVEKPIHVFHRRFEWIETNRRLDARALETVVRKLAYRADREASVAQPIVEGIIRPEGYRVHIVLDVVSTHGHSFTIRKYRESPYSIVDLINSNMVDAGVAALLWLAAENKQGIIFYGPTGSGKTTLLNAVAMLLPSEMKIVTAEDTQEIRLPFHENWMSMVTRLSSDASVQSVTIQAQIESAMRQRPDVLIVGEIRSRESYGFFQAVSTGHGGLTTIHAENVASLIRRLLTPPMNVPPSMIATAKLLTQVQRLLYKGSVIRRATHIHEIEGYDPTQNRLSVKLMCRWSREEDTWRFNLRGSRLIRDVSDLLLIRYEDVVDDLRKRATVLLYAAKMNLDIVQLHTLVRRYRREPDKTYREAVEFVKEPYTFRTFEEIEREYF